MLCVTSNRDLHDANACEYTCACVCVCLSRLAFYGIVSGLPLFFKNELGMGAGYAAVMAFVFAGTCYVTPVLGGWVADSWLGRYKTILYV